MPKIKLSVVIPSYKDPYLFKTIKDLLSKSELGDQLEIIAVWDGYFPPADIIINDERVRYVHIGRNGGMRKAINRGISVARGEFFMRLDEHCIFDKGYDKKLTDACHKDWVMTARRFFLDPVKWEVMDIAPVEHEKLVIQHIAEGVDKFAGQRWRSRDKKQKNVMISETLAQQGSMWIAHRGFFLKTVGELQTEGYGPLIQDSVEVSMKYWQAGGKIMLNKKTWFAHKHRSFARTHNNGTKETPAKCNDGYVYAMKVWGDYYNRVIKPKWKI